MTSILKYQFVLNGYLFVSSLSIRISEKHIFKNTRLNSSMFVYACFKNILMSNMLQS